MKKLTLENAFSLIEMIVVLIIIAIMAEVVFVNTAGTSEQSKVQAVENVMYTISTGEAKYFEDYGSYCTSTTGNAANCGNSADNLNANLRLNLPHLNSDAFWANYSCAIYAGAATNPPTLYTCTTNDGTYTVNLTVTTQSSNLTCVPGGTCP